MDTERGAMFHGLRAVILGAIPQNFTKSTMVNNGETAASDGGWNETPSNTITQLEVGKTFIQLLSLSQHHDARYSTN